jgi:hypothetical protein
LRRTLSFFRHQIELECNVNDWKTPMLPAEKMPPPAVVDQCRERHQALEQALGARDPDQIGKIVLPLLHAFQRRAGEGDVRLSVGVYKAVLRNFPPWAVAEAAAQFAGGQVPGHNKAFPPSTAEVAACVRGLLEPFQVELAQLAILIECQPAPPVDQEHRKRMAERFDELLTDLRGNNSKGKVDA